MNTVLALVGTIAVIGAAYVAFTKIRARYGKTIRTTVADAVEKGRVFHDRIR